MDGYTLGSIFCLYRGIIGVGGLEACQVFGVFLCLGGVLKPSVCEVGQESACLFLIVFKWARVLSVPVFEFR